MMGEPSLIKHTCAMATKTHQTKKTGGCEKEQRARGSNSNLVLDSEPEREELSDAMGENIDSNPATPSSIGDGNEAGNLNREMSPIVDILTVSDDSREGKCTEGVEKGTQGGSLKLSSHSRKRTVDGEMVEEEDEHSDTDSIISGLSGMTGQSIEIGERRYILARRGRKPTTGAWYVKQEHDKLRAEELER